MSEVQLSAISKINSLWKRLASKPYRDAFVSAKIDGDLAAQIFALREQQDLTQEELGVHASMAQSRIAKLEGTCEGVSLATLKRLAAAFDVALQVRFVPFSEVIASTVRYNLDRPIPRFTNDQVPVDGFQTSTSVETGRKGDLPSLRPSGQPTPYVRSFAPTASSASSDRRVGL